MADPRPITREDLAKFLPNQRAIRAFEKLFDLIPSELENQSTLAQEASIDAGIADSKAVQALDAIIRIADALDTLPARETHGIQGDAAPALRESGEDSIGSNPPTADRSLVDGDLTVNGDLVLAKTEGAGIKVDKVSPSFGWHDLLGEPHIHEASANDPVWSVYRGTIRQFQYSNVLMNETWYEYHIPHDYVSGTDLFVHVHWSQIAVDTGGPAGVPGDAKFYFDITYAQGHGTPGGSADPFGAAVTTSVTQQASTTQYGHMLAETIITDDGTSLIDRNRIAPDGVLFVRMYRDPADADDTLDQAPFIHYVDIHYQTPNIGTKQKTPDFYV